MTFTQAIDCSRGKNRTNQILLDLTLRAAAYGWDDYLPHRAQRGGEGPAEEPAGRATILFFLLFFLHTSR